MTDPYGTIDDETPVADRWEQEQDEVSDVEDEEAPVDDPSPGAYGMEADPADVHEQTLDVPDDELRQE